MRRVLSFLFLLCLLTGLAAAQAAAPPAPCPSTSMTSPPANMAR